MGEVKDLLESQRKPDDTVPTRSSLKTATRASIEWKRIQREGLPVRDEQLRLTGERMPIEGPGLAARIHELGQREAEVRRRAAIAQVQRMKQQWAN